MAAPAPSFVDGFAGAVGNTPLIRIKSLSDATGCTILGKAEFLNPGGCNKDRVAKQMVEEAEAVRAGAVSILLRIVCMCASPRVLLRKARRTESRTHLPPI